MERSIATVLPAQRVIDDGDMRLWRALPLPDRQSLGPFVFIDHYRHRSKRGIGDRPHPHAGIEVLSYLLEGGMEHRDSAGFTDRIEAGDAQWIRAGRGILHAEQPFGGRHGLQLWTSLPPDQKLAEPTYKSVRSVEIPEITVPGGLIRVLAGRVDGIDGALALTSPTLLAHVRLDTGARVTLDVDPAQELGLYVLDGASEAPEPLEPGMLGVLTPGPRLTLGAAQQTDVAVLGGARVEGPFLFAGPFVMDTAERLAQAKRDFAEGRMGRLDGVPF